MWRIPFVVGVRFGGTQVQGQLGYPFWLFCPILEDYGWFWAKSGLKCLFRLVLWSFLRFFGLFYVSSLISTFKSVFDQSQGQPGFFHSFLAILPNFGVFLLVLGKRGVILKFPRSCWLFFKILASFSSS